MAGFWIVKEKVGLHKFNFLIISVIKTLTIHLLFYELF